MKVGGEAFADILGREGEEEKTAVEEERIGGVAIPEENTEGGQKQENKEI